MVDHWILPIWMLQKLQNLSTSDCYFEAISIVHPRGLFRSCCNQTNFKTFCNYKRRSCFDQNKDLAQFLICAGSDVDSQNNHGLTLLMKAATIGSEVITKLLLENNADIDMASKDGHTAFHLATCSTAARTAIGVFPIPFDIVKRSITICFSFNRFKFGANVIA